MESLLLNLTPKLSYNWKYYIFQLDWSSLSCFWLNLKTEKETHHKNFSYMYLLLCTCNTYVRVHIDIKYIYRHLFSKKETITKYCLYFSITKNENFLKDGISFWSNNVHFLKFGFWSHSYLHIFSLKCSFVVYLKGLFSFTPLISESSVYIIETWNVLGWKGP